MSQVKIGPRGGILKSRQDAGAANQSKEVGRLGLWKCSKR